MSMGAPGSVATLGARQLGSQSDLECKCVTQSTHVYQKPADVFPTSRSAWVGFGQAIPTRRRIDAKFYLGSLDWKIPGASISQSSHNQELQLIESPDSYIKRIAASNGEDVFDADQAITFGQIAPLGTANRRVAAGAFYNCLSESFL
jgi:hypothetical protein